MTSQNPEKKPPPGQIQVFVPPEVAPGTYANFTIVNHRETEFVFDFVFVQPLDPRAPVRARVISSPKHAKRFLKVLQDHVAQYEQRFGAIDATGTEDTPVH